MSNRILPVSAPVIYLLLLFLIGPAALMQGNNPLLWMLCVLIVIGVLAWYLTRQMLNDLQVRRILPDHGQVGEPVPVEYRLSRTSRFLPAFDITVTERLSSMMKDASSAWILHVGPGETVHGEGLFVPTRRGRLQFNEVEVRTAFPMGIMPRRKRLHVPQDLRVHPEMYPLRPALIRSLLGTGGQGRRSIDRNGSGLDYFGTRSIRPGDGIRDIAWKISARRDEWIAIERSLPASPRIRVVLDLTIPTDALQVASDDRWTASQLEENAISLAASILQDASTRGYDIGLSVQGLDCPMHGLRGGLRHLGRILGSLADLDLTHERRPWSAIPERERAGLVVIHPDRVRKTLNRSDAWHLTARQLDDLVSTNVADPDGNDLSGSVA
ncbi:MAG: hypothetical protein CMJ40_00290 [Phycisphaerae bacterium]|nr:hypothetical protein [Phycisphaerae bacterium]|tara:strand:- start:260 stop:1408 length:1149 start_codon:yes stop_codon:yes gene_type:complete